jgi:CMP-N-acetylneuraminic acid synthetase
MATLAVIPARGGSKGIPRKNIVDFAGKPLIAWTIEAARLAGIERVLVSTDDPEIADVARRFDAEVPFLRPAHLSGDDAAALPVVLHALEQVGAETVVLLQPTSPLRTAADVSGSLKLHHATGRPVVPWLFTMGEDGGLTPSLPLQDRRQNAQFFAPNGAIYVAKAVKLRSGESWWSNAVGFEMPAERSIDIDEPADLVIARALLENGSNRL